MNFCSVNFLFLFLPLLFAVYFLLGAKYRNIVLILFSFLFYFLSEKFFALLLLFSCAANYFIAKKIQNSKKCLVFGVTLNVCLLCFFKYLNFFVSQINALNIFPEITVSPVHLPVGISFFTFQALSYLIDISRKEIKPVKFSQFALYFTLFPQLVAGPIVRFSEIEKDIINRKFNSENFYEGIKRFIIGLSKKVIIADTLSCAADSIFALNVQELSSAVCILGALCYTFQIFFDFSGYSDMAIGLGKMFNFNLPENFNYPYISASIREFWRRWHMTLSRWFKDYLYIPLGGNRKNVYFNLLFVFFLTGLWHGAGWNFIAWGLYNGILICLERLWLSNIFEKLPKAISHIYFIFAVVTGWVIFRCQSLHHAFDFLKAMFGFGASSSPAPLGSFLNNEIIFILIVACLLSFPLANYIKKYIPNFIKTLCYIALVIVSASYIAVNTYQPFIYFRF